MYGLDFSGPQVVRKSDVIPLLSHPAVTPVTKIIVPSAHMSKMIVWRFMTSNDLGGYLLG